MATKELTHANFDTETDRPGLIFIDFWAEWCAPCKGFAPVFEAASVKYPNILFGKIDTESETELAAQFEIRGLPTMIIVKDGEIVAAKVGTLTPAKLDALIQQFS